MDMKLLIASATLAVGGACIPAHAADTAPPSPSPAPAKTEKPNCLKETGTRLKLKDGACLTAPGQVITHDQIENSGALTTEEAIRKLSPMAH